MQALYFTSAEIELYSRFQYLLLIDYSKVVIRSRQPSGYTQCSLVILSSSRHHVPASQQFLLRKLILPKKLTNSNIEIQVLHTIPYIYFQDWSMLVGGWAVMKGIASHHKKANSARI